MSDEFEEYQRLSAKAVSTEELDALVRQLDSTWAEVERTKKIAAEARAVYDEVELKVLELLKQAKKTKYPVDGLGTVSITSRFQVRTPKSIEDKSALFKYISEHHGQDGLLGLLSINSQTLNSFVKQEKETNPLVEIPGLEAPTIVEGLSFRAERK